ncbi:MAG TPA: hypothetical protein VFQ85_10820 [Mycobacteriales bacterium]|nr:hypothetical protein [Mycobacteriales bacterium]
MRRRGRYALAAASVLLLSACASDSPTERARRIASRHARREHAVIGFAVALLAVLVVRWVAAFQARHRPPKPHQHPLPALLAAAALASDVTGLLLVGYVGAGVGYALVPVPDPPESDFGLVVAWAVFGLPVAVGLVWVGVLYLRLPDRLPWVSTTTFVTAGLGHALTFLLGAAVALDVSTAFDQWRVLGAVLAATGLVGLLGYAAGVGARSGRR